MDGLQLLTYDMIKKKKLSLSPHGALVLINELDCSPFSIFWRKCGCSGGISLKILTRTLCGATWGWASL